MPAWIDRTLFYSLIPSFFLIISHLLSLVEDNVESELDRIDELRVILEGKPDEKETVVYTIEGAISVNNFFLTTILTAVNVIVLLNSAFGGSTKLDIIGTIVGICLLIFILLALKYIRKYNFYQLSTYIPDMVPLVTGITFTKMFSRLQFILNLLFFFAIIWIAYCKS